jgi:hypothetical protein
MCAKEYNDEEECSNAKEKEEKYLEKEVISTYQDK